MLCFMRIRQLNKPLNKADYEEPTMTLNLIRPSTGSTLTLVTDVMDDCDLWDWLGYNYPGWQLNALTVDTEEMEDA